MSIFISSQVGGSAQEWWHLVRDQDESAFYLVHEWRRIDHNHNADSGSARYEITEVKARLPLIYKLVQSQLLIEESRAVKIEMNAEYQLNE